VSASGTVLVVGVGGLGTPCARTLADAGVAHLVLMDPDVIDASNLPRQLLFEADDVGRPKAEVAAARLHRPGLDVRAVVGRFDATTAAAALRGVDVVVDATDGAASKDVVHGLAVAAGLPVVHAAALGSEARVLDVAAGGRPCFACLFGLLATGDDADTCARFGVFPGVVRAAGELAAAAALDRLASPRAPTKGLRVLDLGAGRAVTLAVAADPQCPVCRPGAPAPVFAPPSAAPRAVAEAPAPPAGALDLRAESCPLNLLRARRAVGALAPGGTLEVWLGAEGAASVPDGLVSLGHAVTTRTPRGDGLVVTVRRGGTRPTGHASNVAGSAAAGTAPPVVGDDAWLRRYARQIVLPGVGEDGQRRWGEAQATVTGSGDAADACAETLARGGFGAVARVPGAVGAAVEVTTRGPGTVRCALARGGVGPTARARGALLADAVMRAVLELPATSDVVVRDDGTVGAA